MKPTPVPSGLKPKDLAGIPWRVAFALQADGWYLRQDIIWSKPNPMPESVTDRCTKAHEYIFLLTKSERYYYDAVAIMEAGVKTHAQQSYHNIDNKKYDSAPHTRWKDQFDGRVWGDDGIRNKRSVWAVPSHPYSGAHFATFPPALIEPCILAGTSARGCCPDCGAPWRRVVERAAMVIRRSERTHALGRTRSSGTVEEPAQMRTVGWEPSCKCGSKKTVPAVVLDPFGGAGTTAVVAERLGRSAVLLELSPEYAEMARERVARESDNCGFLRSDARAEPAVR